MKVSSSRSLFSFSSLVVYEPFVSATCVGRWWQAWQATGRMASRENGFLMVSGNCCIAPYPFWIFQIWLRIKFWVGTRCQRHNNNCDVIHKGQHQYYVNAHFRRSSDEALVNCLCHPLLHADFYHGAWCLPERENKEQTVNHIGLGIQLLTRTQKGTCYKLGDSGASKRNEISDLPCRTWSCTSPFHRTWTNTSRRSPVWL